LAFSTKVRTLATGRIRRSRAGA